MKYTLGLTSTSAFSESLLLAIVLTGMSYIIGIQSGWIESLNWLEIFAVFASYSCTYLCVMQKRFNYVIGMLATAALCILFFYQEGLFASAAQNAILTPWLIYGWFRWRADAVTRPVTSVLNDSKSWLAAYVGLTFLTYYVIVQTVEYLGGNLPYIDAGILVGSILAQILLDNKKKETWYVWAIVNVAAIALYFKQGLYLLAFQFVFFLINTVWGWYEWNKSMKKEFSFEFAR